FNKTNTIEISIDKPDILAQSSHIACQSRQYAFKLRLYLRQALPHLPECDDTARFIPMYPCSHDESRPSLTSAIITQNSAYSRRVLQMRTADIDKFFNVFFHI